MAFLSCVATKLDAFFVLFGEASQRSRENKLLCSTDVKLSRPVRSLDGAYSSRVPRHENQFGLLLKVPRFLMFPCRFGSSVQNNNKISGIAPGVVHTGEAVEREYLTCAGCERKFDHSGPTTCSKHKWVAEWHYHRLYSGF